MIVFIVCLLLIVLAWNLAGAYFKLLAACIDLAIQLIKLAWRLLAAAYCWFQRWRGGKPPRPPARAIPSAQEGPTGGAADIRPLKDDRPINGRLSDYYKK